MNSKTCRKCDVTKPVTEFSRRNTESRDGLHPWCQECKRAYERAYRVNNLERVKAKERRWRESNKAHYLEYQKHAYRQRREVEREALEWVKESRR